jgi:hypothetical protein
MLSKDDLWDALKEYPDARKILIAKVESLCVRLILDLRVLGTGNSKERQSA